jgi:glycosyltransferase involved in cell wall biosynthesis
MKSVRQDIEPREEKPEFSVIVTSYYEEKSIEEFYERLSSALRSLGRSYEIIMVNDGSEDKTFEKMRVIFEADEKVHTIIDFFRNSGQLAAMTAGICYSRGDAIIFIDSDLQLAPEELPLLVAEYDKGYDLVSGYRKNRKDSLTRRLPSKVANMIMRKVSQTDLQDFGCTFKLYNAKVLREFEFGPFKLFNTASVISNIQRYKEVPVTHYTRKYDKSGWTFKKLWQFNMDNIVNFSQRPFQIMGVLCLFTSFLFIVRLGSELIFPFKLLSEVSNGLILNGIIISLLIVMAVLCIIGEFTIRSFLATQKYPYYIIREIVRR